MKRKRLLAFLLAGCSSVSCLLACGDGGNGDGSGSGGANTEQGGSNGGSSNGGSNGGSSSSSSSDTPTAEFIQGTYKMKSITVDGVTYQPGDALQGVGVTEDSYMMGLRLDGTGYISFMGNNMEITWEEVDGIYTVNVGDQQILTFTKDGLYAKYTVDKDNGIMFVKTSNGVNASDFGFGGSGDNSGSGSGSEKPSGGVVNPEKPNDGDNDDGDNDGGNSGTTVPTKQYTRVDEEGKESDTGACVLFGEYPQSRVFDAATLENLSAQAGSLPTETNVGKWTDYGYYSNGEVASYMWYIDVETNGETYRGVYFDEYRPWFTSEAPSTDNTHQIENGYYKETVYWFAYEPIQWRILKEDNGEATLLCEMIIDAQAYQNDIVQGTGGYYYVNGNDAPNQTYANNYQYSTIRSWLNDTFYETAFSKQDKDIIVKTTVDNSKSTTHNKETNGFAGKTTQDNVWLMSYQELLNTEYGFNKNANNYDALRRKKGTAYALCQGAQCFPDTGSSYQCGLWMLRSPYYGYSHLISYVMSSGVITAGQTTCGVNKQMMGVVPALKITL